MLTINALNLRTQEIYRIFPPKGIYFLSFKLDPKSKYNLTEEARKLSSPSEVTKFEEGIQEAAIICALKIPEKEIKSGNILEWQRLQIDPKYTGTTFAFQIKQDGEKNKLAVTKASVFTSQENNNETSRQAAPLVSELNLPTQFVTTNIWVIPVSIEYFLDDATTVHLTEHAAGLKNEGEVEDFENTIRKAVRIAAHKMVNNGLILRPQGSNIKWRYKDEESSLEYKFLFTIINGRRFLVKKIRIKALFENF